MVHSTLRVETALGEQLLAEGIVHTHEHLWLNLTTPRDPLGKLDQLYQVVAEMRELKTLGVSAVMEMTCRGMGRDLERLAQIQRQSGVQVLPSAGFYYKGFHPEIVASSSADKLASLLAADVRDGIAPTGARPMILGEIGGSGPQLDPDEVKVFRAVARAASECPVVVMTHAHLGTGGQAELDILLEEGLSPERISIGHMDLCPSIPEVLRIAEQGAYVGIDTIGKAKYAPDERRVEYIRALFEAGYGERILLSCDISRNSYLRSEGGHGYAHLVRNFLPMLQAAGVSQELVQQFTAANPRRFLAGANVAAKALLGEEDVPC